MAKLTPKQQRFVEEYLTDLNATQAYIRAGYQVKNEDTAAVMASRLLRNDKVQEAIKIARAEISERTKITQDKVLNELAKIGFSNMLDYVTPTNSGDLIPDFSALTRDQAAAISEVTIEEYTEGRGDDAQNVKRTKFKLSDKRAALVDIGRHLGMFPSRLEHTGKNGAPIQTENLHVNLNMTEEEADRRIAELQAKLDAKHGQ